MLLDSAQQLSAGGVGECGKDLPSDRHHGVANEPEASVLCEAFELLDKRHRLFHSLRPEVNDEHIGAILSFPK